MPAPGFAYLPGAGATALPTFSEDGFVHVLVEVSRGARVKVAYDPALGTFRYLRSLPPGLAYPYDWGFVPSTCGEDGDPLDAIVLHEDSTPAGTIIRCRLLGILRVQQTENGRTVRNDRFFLSPAAGEAPGALTRFNQFDRQARRNLQQFLTAAVSETGKDLQFKGWQGAAAARAALRQGATVFAGASAGSSRE